MNWQSEREQSFYAELFQSCDSEGSGRISWAQAAELFRSTRLSQDILVQVGIVSWNASQMRLTSKDARGDERTWV